MNKYTLAYRSRGFCDSGLHPNDRLPASQCTACRDRNLEQAKARRRKLKQQVIQKYGNKCACCKETILDFLTIDHIDNNGKDDGDSSFYRRLLTNPLREDLRVLCFNCNLGRKVTGGICPHDA